ncbi:hypothetical protein LJC45_02460 [Alistipes sp. OttesenSCG-928-B03]|nr:hypothetical protein [Alistipes sp. OttesenSCG-928-B03]
MPISHDIPAGDAITRDILEYRDNNWLGLSRPCRAPSARQGFLTHMAAECGDLMKMLKNSGKHLCDDKKARIFVPLQSRKYEIQYGKQFLVVAFTTLRSWIADAVCLRIME